MATDPRVDLTFSLFKPRYIQTGVDPFDLERLVERIDRWEDWCRIWSEEAKVHETLAEKALERGRALTAGGSLPQGVDVLSLWQALLSGRRRRIPRCARKHASPLTRRPPRASLRRWSTSRLHFRPDIWPPISGSLKARKGSGRRHHPRARRVQRRNSTPGAMRSSIAAWQRSPSTGQGRVRRLSGIRSARIGDV